MHAPRRDALIPSRRSTSLTRGRRQLRNVFAASLMLLAAFLPLAVLSLLSHLAPTLGAILNAVAVCALVAFTIRELGRSYRRRREATQTRIELDARIRSELARRGLAHTPCHDPRVAQLKSQLVRHAQQEVLNSLHERVGYAPPDTDMLDSVLARIRERKLSFQLAIGIGLFGLIPCVLAEGTAGVSLMMWFVGILLFVMFAFIMVEALIKHRPVIVEQQLFEHERRRIASIAELAGGLSIAHEATDPLDGALSPSHSAHASLELHDGPERAH
jgi:Flp pilus assembly protein TadB